MEWLPLGVMQEAELGKLRGHWKRHDASPADPEAGGVVANNEQALD